MILSLNSGGKLYLGALEMLPLAVRHSRGIAIHSIFGVPGFAFICLINIPTHCLRFFLYIVDGPLIDFLNNHHTDRPLFRTV